MDFMMQSISALRLVCLSGYLQLLKCLHQVWISECWQPYFDAGFYCDNVTAGRAVTASSLQGNRCCGFDDAIHVRLAATIVSKT